MFGGDRNHGGFKGSSVDFAFLADGATLDILFDVLSHAGPPEVSLGKGIGIGNSWVSGGLIIVEKLNYPLFRSLSLATTGQVPFHQCPYSFMSWWVFDHRLINGCRLLLTWSAITLLWTDW